MVLNIALQNNFFPLRFLEGEKQTELDRVKVISQDKGVDLVCGLDFGMLWTSRNKWKRVSEQVSLRAGERRRGRERGPEILHLKCAVVAYWGNPFLIDHLLLKTKLNLFSLNPLKIEH